MGEGTALMTHPMFSPEVRDSWSRFGIPTRGDETPPGRNATFYHATRQNLDGETHVTSPASQGRSSSGSADDTNWFAARDPSRLRRSYGGKNVYQVEPTGPFTDNFDTPGELSGEYASQHPLRILSKVQFDAPGGS